MEDLKAFINFIIKYKCSFGLNSIKLKKNWFVCNHYEKEYNEILKRTTFLQTNLLSERIYCLLNDITQKVLVYHKIKFKLMEKQRQKIQ